MIEALLVIVIFLLLIALKLLVDIEKDIKICQSNNKLIINILRDFTQDVLYAHDNIEEEISILRDKLENKKI